MLVHLSGEVGGAAEAKGKQANELQRAAGEATGRDGSQIPDKMQQVGDASGARPLVVLRLPSAARALLKIQLAGKDMGGAASPTGWCLLLCTALVRC